jgi:hydroxymethylglutaryl-CoA reductase
MSHPTPDFLDLTPAERRDFLKRVANLSDEELSVFCSQVGLGLESADKMIENVVGLVSIPMGIAAGFLVNGMDYIVPMATEQRAVITMATRGATLVRGVGGFLAESTSPTMMGQIQLTRVPDFEEARRRILACEDEILSRANTQSSTRKAIGLEVKPLETSVGPMLIVELLVDVKDSLGANVVDSMCEAVAPIVSSLAGGKTGLRVVSNLATRRLVRVEAVIEEEALGKEVAEGIAEASSFAEADPYRAATHNKGIMNGVVAVALATSQDHRALEAGAHAYASLGGRYRPLSRWSLDDIGNLRGELVMPMPVGVIGGSVSTHPTARVALKILGVRTANELGEVAASVGLACNLAALQALVTTRITGI